MSTNAYTRATTDDCRIISLERFGDLSGTFSIVENGASSPLGYDVRRVYYLFDVPAGASRGGHSHHGQSAFLIAVSGSFDVTVDDGHRRAVHHLSWPDRGLLIVPGIWREIDNFSAGAVCMVLSSDVYDESDYVRDYDEFMTLSAGKE